MTEFTAILPEEGPDRRVQRPSFRRVAALSEHPWRSPPEHSIGVVATSKAPAGKTRPASPQVTATERARCSREGAGDPILRPRRSASSIPVIGSLLSGKKPNSIKADSQSQCPKSTARTAFLYRARGSPPPCIDLRLPLSIPHSRPQQRPAPARGTCVNRFAPFAQFPLARDRAPDAGLPYPSAFQGWGSVRLVTNGPKTLTGLHQPD
jgi:hypothetical protein